MLSSGANVIIWDEMLLSGMKGYHLELMLFYVPASYIMYLSDFCRFLLCTCEWERRGERRAGEGEGARERGIECILYRYS